jgi:AraC family transcriptional regulator of adaptative response/methylated-DNA-[protein]-cysteine methyltransferase
MNRRDERRPREAGEAIERRIAQLCRYIDAHADEVLSLEALGRRAAMSPGHLQRRFKELVGVSPRQYQEAGRLRRLKQDLREGEPVSQAIYGAGFGSVSRVYERAARTLGMTPRQYRAGGAGIELSYAAADTPLGLLMMAASDRGLVFVQFGASEAALSGQLRIEFPRAALSAMDPAQHAPFAVWMRALCAYLSGQRRPLDLPLDLRGTAFQLRVWRCLQQIPYGELRSYGEVAQAIGAPKAVRAVASACAANRVALAVPCHRVIRGDGGLGGYRWGLDRKRSLLDRERASRAGVCDEADAGCLPVSA